MKILTSAPHSRRLGRLFVACFIFSTGLAATTAARQGAITGTWRIDFDREQPDLVSLSILRGSSRSDGPIALGELQGLTREQAFGAGQAVKFRIVREAGTFECEGRFSGGKGSGSWQLFPNESFVAEMRSRGYALSSDRELFESALFGVNLKSVDELKAAGYDHIPFNKLIETRIFDVNAELIEEMRGAGYTNLTLNELVEARIFKIDSKYIGEVQSLGFGRPSFKQLVEMRSQNVTADYAREMRAAGFDLSPRELVDFKVFGVTSSFIKELKEEGYPSITPRQIVDLRVFQIDAAYIRRAKANGFPNATVEQIVNLRMNGTVK
ncbi:MAG: hypothetical protein ACJ741_00755 [Pyrinomonadaceae bacterium]